MKFSNYSLRGLCIENNWFTAGSNYQYSSLFEMNRNGASIHDLALVIWICSVDWTLEDIEKVLETNREG